MQHRRLPAEWEPQAAILLTWPHSSGAWGKDYGLVEKTFIEIAKSIASSETVIITAFDESHRQHILMHLASHNVDLNFVQTYLAPSNDVWARDHGPITIIEDKQTILCDFKFNAWGGKYEYVLDEQIPMHLYQAQLLKGYQYRKVDFILEGGAIETDGHGTLLTTSQCLLTTTRNALTQNSIETKLKEFLGVNRILWLNDGSIMGDDTDCHIDTLARFLNPHTIAYVDCNSAMYESLRSFKDYHGKPYHLVPLPVPNPKYDHQGKPLPATYANFLITNDKVLIPLYDDKEDDHALAILKEYFPQRKVVGINCLKVIEQYGSLHCLTMQIPRIWETQ